MDVIRYIKLEKGTILYRTALTTSLQSRKCGDTAKTGLYFSLNPLIPVCMLLENRENPLLIKLRLKNPVFIAEGKYSFREINPNRYFVSSEKGGGLILNQTPTAKENISHISFDVQPLKTDEKTGELQSLTRNIITGGNEVFLSSKDLKIVEIVEVYDFIVDNHNKLEEFIRKIDFSTDFKDYKPILSLLSKKN